MPAKTRDYMTIGEVVETLGKTHPDVTISKIRFLEEEGLVSPERTAGGYRKFVPADLARIELVLRLQKEHFLPLAVIREKLRDIEKGKMPADLRPVGAKAEAVALPFEEAETVSLDKAPAALGLPLSFIKELIEYGLLSPTKGEAGEELTRADVQVAHAAWDLRRYGVEPRHLRMYETLAEREASIFAQILLPAFRQRTPEARTKLAETLAELSSVTGDLKRHLLERALARTFDE
ncbi:MAG TPA: MerR family transcriptional regulator [Coriobacteriia bacterium]|jgi:DNA-binding transcriptional MerR regulator